MLKEWMTIERGKILLEMEMSEKDPGLDYVHDA
jgi:hypothetical protein